MIESGPPVFWIRAWTDRFGIGRSNVSTKVVSFIFISRFICHREKISRRVCKQSVSDNTQESSFVPIVYATRVYHTRNAVWSLHMEIKMYLST